MPVFGEIESGMCVMATGLTRHGSNILTQYEYVATSSLDIYISGLEMKEGQAI